MPNLFENCSMSDSHFGPAFTENVFPTGKCITRKISTKKNTKEKSNELGFRLQTTFTDCNWPWTLTNYSNALCINRRRFTSPTVIWRSPTSLKNANTTRWTRPRENSSSKRLGINVKITIKCPLCAQDFCAHCVPKLLGVRVWYNFGMANSINWLNLVVKAPHAQELQNSMGKWV